MLNNSLIATSFLKNFKIIVSGKKYALFYLTSRIENLINFWSKLVHYFMTIFIFIV